MSDVIQQVLTGKYVCVYGAGGTGKSFLINTIKTFFEGDTLFVSPTGQGALNIEGMTCHKLFGLPFGMTDTLHPLNRNMQALLKDRKLNRIVIDESWMLRADMLDHIDARLRKVRRSSEPFGGVSVVLVGDPYQLPPVLTDKEFAGFKAQYNTPYMFGSRVWQQCDWRMIELTEVKRQKDVEFIKALNSIRKCDFGVRDAISFINEKCLNKPQQGVILSPRNFEVDRYNRQEFQRLSTPIQTFEGKNFGYKGTLPIDESISLREGARVVLCVNTPEYVNGDSGRITRCLKGSVTVKLDRGEVVNVKPFRYSQIEYRRVGNNIMPVETGAYEQMPIKHSWAISCHRSQGMTLSNVSFDTGGKVFAPSLTYVALSRAKTLDGLTLIQPIMEKDIWVDRDVREYFESQGV